VRLVRAEKQEGEEGGDIWKLRAEGSERSEEGEGLPHICLVFNVKEYELKKKKLGKDGRIGREGDKKFQGRGKRHGPGSAKEQNPNTGKEKNDTFNFSDQTGTFSVSMVVSNNIRGAEGGEGEEGGDIPGRGGDWGEKFPPPWSWIRGEHLDGGELGEGMKEGGIPGNGDILEVGEDGEVRDESWVEMVLVEGGERGQPVDDTEGSVKAGGRVLKEELVGEGLPGFRNHAEEQQEGGPLEIFGLHSFPPENWESIGKCFSSSLFKACWSKLRPVCLWVVESKGGKSEGGERSISCNS
jgi:hypothetical protein